MTLFYAYFKNINDDWSYRYLAVFPSRDVADEWWRAISATTNYAASVRRVTSQFYTHDSSKALASTSLTDPKGTPQFLNQVFFTLLNDRDGRILSIAPRDYGRDLISGQTYYIRSKTSPSEYWYIPRSNSSSEVATSHQVTVSTTDRTLFRITRTDANSDGTVMIKGDSVVLTDVVSGAAISFGRDQVVIVNNPDGGNQGFQFGSFASGFRADRFWDRIVKTDNGLGEAWELV
ncbi:hypothetical protein CPB83DRAFT_846690 [Crepidotus variabilis]|uniref:Uncharacterized protein n=1 Tax=Crepidotus variabilis TaxID=179855 RepID=A0A9P6EPF1_9AGAR|nr:hypothetical protein CPB83DRAFT_846690 [Crepidotus variabilis]